MTDEKSPLEQALDVFVYAPLGLVFSARELLPSLAEKGRNQLGMAKMVGQFAAKQGQQEAEKRLGPLRDQAMSTLEQLAGGSRGSTSNGSAPAPTPEVATTDEVKAATESAVATPIVVTPPTSGPEAATLAIPDYDSLSASQVVPRLQGLSTDELEAVREYEAAHRGRKTILNRVAQLQS
ncbi:MAG TPA: hypothetical protein VEA78_06870 [Acidimicrobiales bacterium]|nr:hypothetical protein [Acidimicrobiales bacterium]